MRTRLDSGKPAPDALFAGSDTMALGALAALREHGVDVPTTCNVCGYDDSPLALHHSPALTTVRQDTRIPGAILVERLMQSMQRSEEHTSELQSLMRISYAVLRFHKKKHNQTSHTHNK